MPKYTIGIDFGTESARAVLVDLRDGRQVAEAVYPYPDGVIDERLPGTGIRLEPDWALQNPADYLSAIKETIPRLLKESGVSPED
ncbi:MAG: ribulokinase, partial [Chloroflexi bacterium]|nr:ribulokinase [Chloroflexota bacterium]